MSQVIFLNLASSNYNDNKDPNNNGFHFSRYLGPHRLSSWLNQNNISTQVIDFVNALTYNQLKDLLETFIDERTTTIGVSTTFFKEHEKNPKWLLEIKKYFQEKYPSITWIAGGQRVHFLDDTFIKFDSFAEQSLLYYLTKQNKTFDIQNAGIAFTNNNKIDKDEVLPIELGRGCKFKCKFCDYRLIGKKPGTYLRNFNLVEKEILYYYENFGVTRFSYVDDTVNESVEKVNALVAIKEKMPFDLEWTGYCRADLIWRYPNMIDDLRRSGMRSCFFGIESFEERSAKLIGKGWAGQHGKEFLLHLKKNWYPDINWEMGFITGLPGQTESQLRDDNKWLQDNDLNGYFIGLDLSSRKSEFAVNAEKYGFSFPNKDAYWENGIWTAKSASKIADEFRQQNQNRTKLAAFALSMFGGVGYEWSEMINIKHVDFYTDEFYDKKQKKVDKYVSTML